MGEFVCVECGLPVDELYHQFRAGSIKIVHCPSCGQVADKYIEYDPVLISLDTLLHKAQTYRHILFNVKLQWHWKLLVVLILCDTYIKWEQSMQQRHLVTSSETLLYAALEWNFYIMLLYTMLEWVVLCFSLCLMLSWVGMHQTESKRRAWLELVKAVTVSSFGKLFLIAAVVWDQRQSLLWLQLTHLLVYTSNVSALRVLYGLDRRRAMMTVALGHASQLLIAALLS